MARKREPTDDALEIIDREFYEGRPDQIAELQKEILNAEAAAAIYKLRTNAGLTQRQLAKRIGTTASVISRLEDSDYDGHSLTMLQRIASELEHRVEIRLTPIKRKRSQRRS